MRIEHRQARTKQEKCKGIGPKGPKGRGSNRMNADFSNLEYR
jgi:hypothetical protein